MGSAVNHWSRAGLHVAPVPEDEHKFPENVCAVTLSSEEQGRTALPVRVITRIRSAPIADIQARHASLHRELYVHPCFLFSHLLAPLFPMLTVVISEVMRPRAYTAPPAGISLFGA